MAGNLMAILRGITPDESESIAETLIENGIDQIEVPLNSPDAFDSIHRIAKKFASQCETGAGTVLTPADVDSVYDAGGRFIVSPNCNEQVIRQTKLRDMDSYPGVLTPTECFSALEWGADALKLFPASLIGPEAVNAIRAVLPQSTKLYAVGGVGVDNIQIWLQSGINGFGIGSYLYKPGMGITEVADRCKKIVNAVNQAK